MSRDIQAVGLIPVHDEAWHQPIVIVIDHWQAMHIVFHLLYRADCSGTGAETASCLLDPQMILMHCVDLIPPSSTYPSLIDCHRAWSTKIYKGPRFHASLSLTPRAMPAYAPFLPLENACLLGVPDTVTLTNPCACEWPCRESMTQGGEAW